MFKNLIFWIRKKWRHIPKNIDKLRQDFKREFAIIIYVYKKYQENITLKQYEKFLMQQNEVYTLYKNYTSDIMQALKEKIDENKKLKEKININEK